MDVDCLEGVAILEKVFECVCPRSSLRILWKLQEIVSWVKRQEDLKVGIIDDWDWLMLNDTKINIFPDAKYKSFMIDQIKFNFLSCCSL